MTGMTHAEIKEKMIWAGKVLVNEGQDDFTRGHISFRLPDNPKLFFMKCHSLGLDEITHDNILTIDLDGKVVAGTSRRHSEVYIHSEIFKVRPDVHCILHTHPTYSIAWSGTGRPLKALSQPAALFYNAVGLYTDTINLIRTTEMGAGVAKALGPGALALPKEQAARLKRASKKTPLLLSAHSRKGVPEALRALAEVVGKAAGDKPKRSRKSAAPAWQP